MIGIFIGSFNPPTLAHLEISLRLKNDFEKIIFVPVNSKEKGLISLRHRVEMLNIYTRKYPFLEINDIMKNYSYLNFRIIDLLKQKYQNITLIMGSDLLDKLDTFDNYEYLLNNYNFLVIERDKYDSRKIIKNKYANYQNKFKIVNYHSDISSTKARELLNDKKINSILDKDIINYIKEHDLY